MRATAAIAIGCLGCAGGAPGGGGGGAPGGPHIVANTKPPARPLPVGCALEPAEPGRAPWERRNPGDCLGIARTVDEGWVVLAFDRLRAYDRDGNPRWDTPLDHLGPDGRTCGYPAGLAVDALGRTAVACGYSLLGFAPDGAFRWQVWPGGNAHTTPPLVDATGTIYVGVEGALYAIAPDDGATRWNVGTGWNRYFSALAPTASGTLMFVTVMAAMHSEDTGSGHFYYDPEPDELFVVDRTGKIVRREIRRDGDATWPAWVDVIGEGGGRIP